MSQGLEEMHQIAEQLLSLGRQAGQAILDIYHSPETLQVQRKDDASPITDADKASHSIIAKGLAALTPQWPVLSEEQAMPAFSERSQWGCYWLVDPLDGTREFIDRTGEFTINIALIENHRPVLGMVYIPLEQVAYMGFVAEGKALRIDATGPKAITVRDASNATMTLLSSSRYGGEELDACAQQLSQHVQQLERLTAGSALKFCRLAEGAADIYPRFSPCCEWDTAAGHAVLEAAGGSLVDTDFKPLQYNSKADILNPNFYALGAAEWPWREILSP